MKYFLGIDHGTTTLKAGLYDINGNEIVTAGSRVNELRPHDGWIERPVDQIWAEHSSVMRQCLTKSGIDPSDILGIAITGHGGGAIFIGEDNKPCYPNQIVCNDTRTIRDYLKKWQADGTWDDVVRSVHQTLYPGQTVPLLAWMKDNLPDIMEKTRAVLTVKDYLRLCLTNEVAIEISDASGIAGMDLRTGKFDPAILEKMGVREYFDRLPKVIGSAEIGGYVTAKAAKDTGLKEGTPVMGGLFDNAAICLASGITDSSRFFLNTGSWCIVGGISRELVEDPSIFMNFIYCMDGYYVHIEGSCTGGSNLQWFVDNLMGEEDKEMKTQGKRVFDAVEKMVLSMPYDDNTIIFLPFLFGTHASLDSKGAFVGLNSRHTKAYILRAVYEGVLFAWMYHIERLNSFRKTPAETICVSGGGTNSDEWVQMLSDALQMRVEVAANKELGTLGAIMCCAVGCGMYDSFEAVSKAFAKVKKVFHPNPERFDYYQKKFKIYKKLVDTLDGIWPEWNTLDKSNNN